MLITEKPGRIYTITREGTKTPVSGVPDVVAQGQNGLLDIAPAPDFARSRTVYLTYVAPARNGSALTLARARFLQETASARLVDLTEIWRQAPVGGGGQPGGIIAFAPDGSSLFLTVGDRMRPASAQDPNHARGKVFRLALDGRIPADNPAARAGGTRGETWSSGHRNPYGLAFDNRGQLWLHEMGPRGGDEFNLITPGGNYGWPEVSFGTQYNGTPIPDHASRPDFAAPALHWTPVIAPAGLVFYDGAMFGEWRGSALIGSLSTTALIRVETGANGTAKEVDRWNIGGRIRDVAVTPDGAVWLIEDAENGRLLRLTPPEAQMD